jgi:hypothetical protein
MELKAETPFKKDGTLKKSEHLDAQAQALDALTARGYWAEFMFDFDSIKEILDWYLRD